MADSDGRISQHHVDVMNTAAHTSLSTASKLAVLRVAKAKAKTNVGPSHNKRFNISFHLCPQDKAIPVSSAAFKKLVHDEYLCKYLETLGVTPTRQTLEKARLQLPQDELKIAAAWKSDTVTVSPLERAAVLNNNRIHAQAAKARFKESRKEAERKKQLKQELQEQERIQEEKEEDRRKGRRREKDGKGGGGGESLNNTNIIVTPPPPTDAQPLSPTRPSTNATTATPRPPLPFPPPTAATFRPSTHAGGRSARSSQARPLHRPLPPVLIGGSSLGLNDVVSSVLAKQESVFEAMRAALDHRRRMGDREEEIEQFWNAARSMSESNSTETFKATTTAEEKTRSTSNSPARKITDIKEGVEDGGGEKDTTPNASPISPSSDNTTSRSNHTHSSQLLQVFTLYHFLHAHNFSTQTRRGAIMSLEESSIAGENILKKKSPASSSMASNSSRAYQERQDRTTRIPEVQIMYWRPKVEEMITPNSSGLAAAMLLPKSQTTKQQADEIILRSSTNAEIDGVSSSGGGGVSFSAPFSPSSSFGFSPMSRSFAPLSQLYHHPFHVTLPEIQQLLRIFFVLFPRYRTGIERNWNEIESHYGVAQAVIQTDSTGSNGLCKWSEKCHDDFGLISSTDGSQLNLSIGAAASISAASMNPLATDSSATHASSQPSKLQAFYNEAEFKSLLTQAASLLTSKKVQELIGLLGHYLYWIIFEEQLNVMRKWRLDELKKAEASGQASPATASLPPIPAQFHADDLNTILLTIQKMYIQLEHSLRKVQHYSLFFLPLLMDLLGTTILNLFHISYPAWFASQYGYGTDQFILRTIDRLFDVYLLSAIPSSMPGNIGGKHISAGSTTTPSTLPTSHVKESLFFHTSELVKRAFPQPGEGARLLRKADVAREWKQKLHAQQLALAIKNAKRREEQQRVMQQLDEHESHASSEKQSSKSGLQLHTADSLAAQSALHASEMRVRMGGNSFGARQPLQLNSTSRHPQPPLTARSATSPTKREHASPPATARSHHRPQSPSSRLPTAGSSTSTPSALSSHSRSRLFELALRKISNRHARDHTAVRLEVAQVPGLKVQ